jgi:hypothetical protein
MHSIFYISKIIYIKQLKDPNEHIIYTLTHLKQYKIPNKNDYYFTTNIFVLITTNI